MKKRHSQFSIVGRLLRECVEVFGKQFNYRIKFHLYHCINDEFLFNENVLQFKYPTSMSSKYQTIANYFHRRITSNDIKYGKYGGNGKSSNSTIHDGIILSFSRAKQNAYNDKLKYIPKFFECQFLSDFVSENEYLFIGGAGALKFDCIYEIGFYVQSKSKINKFVYNYGIFLYLLPILNEFVCGNSCAKDMFFFVKLGNEQQIRNENEQQMICILKSLMYQLFISLDLQTNKNQIKNVFKQQSLNIPSYIKRLFKFYCNTITEVVIDLLVMEENEYIFVEDENVCLGYNFIKELFFNNKGLDIYRYLCFFPNLKQIEIQYYYGLGIYKHSLKMGFEMFDDIIDILSAGKLNELVVKYPNESELSLAEIQNRYRMKFGNIGWKMEIDVEYETDYSKENVSKEYEFNTLVLTKL